MAVKEQLDRLAAFEPAPYPVVSLYLNTQPGQTGRDQFNSFVRKEFAARSRTYEAGSPERESLDKDLERIGRFLNEELDPAANGVAIFACDAGELFEAIQMTAPIEHHWLSIGDQPHLYPLARIESLHPRYAAVLADTNAARILVFATGEVVAEREIKSVKTKRTSQGGWSQARYQRHAENFHLHHAKEVVEALATVVREDQIDHVILAGDEAAVPLIEKELPKYLAEKIVDVMRLDVRAPDDEVLRETLAVLREKDAETDQAVVSHLLDEYRGGGLAITGAAETLSALERGQVDTLVLAASPEAIASADVALGVAPTATHSGSIAEGLDAVDEAAERPAESLPEAAIANQAATELVRRARLTSASIRFIEDAALLHDIGGVGAFLRFRV